MVGSKPAWNSSACKYNRFCVFSELSKNVLINRRPCTCNSPVPPLLFIIPISKRKRTGSPQRSLKVDNASETEVWPLCTLFCEPCPRAVLSHAFVSNCNANIRDRMPWPVAEAANGSKPTVDVPSRMLASGHRVQHKNKHCLQRNEGKRLSIWGGGRVKGAPSSSTTVRTLTDKPIHQWAPAVDTPAWNSSSVSVHSIVDSIVSIAGSPATVLHRPVARLPVLERNCKQCKKCECTKKETPYGDYTLRRLAATHGALYISCMQYKLDYNLVMSYLGKDTLKSANNFDSKSVMEPNCFRDISQSDSGNGGMEFL